MTGWKTWRDKLLIPDTHEPGKTNPAKTKKNPSSEHHSTANKSAVFWPVGKWALGFTDPSRKKEKRR